MFWECPDDDLTVSGKCQSVCVSMCMWAKFCDKCSSRTKRQNLMKFYIWCYPNINWGLSTFGENRSSGGAVVSLYTKFFKYAGLGF